MNFNASNYRQRKAARVAVRPAQWYTNPKTEEKFFLRSAGAMPYTTKGFTPSVLKKTALDGWAEKGVKVEVGETVVTVTPAMLEEQERQNNFFARVVYDAGVVPTFVAQGEDLNDVKERALLNCESAWANDAEWKTLTPEQKLERAADVILDLQDLDDDDATFIFQCATGQLDSNGVPLKGGAVVNMADAKSLRKKPGRRSRARNGSEELRTEAV